MEIYKSLLKGNQRWVREKLDDDPDYFSNLSKTQTPEILWIGCADSRVPANQITGTNPGDIFVHRNIANMVVHTDMNMLSVLDYSVNVLNVKHVIVCGHYGCGGGKAAMGSSSGGIIDSWIRHIQDSYKFRKSDIEAIEDEQERFDRVVEWNTKQQVLNLSVTSIVQEAWSRGQDLSVHGWVYGLDTGLVKDLDVTFSSHDDIRNSSIYKLDFE